MGPKGPKIRGAQGPWGPRGPRYALKSKINVLIGVLIKDGKTKLWENEATHLRSIKKVWTCVKNTFICIIWGVRGPGV